MNRIFFKAFSTTKLIKFSTYKRTVFQYTLRVSSNCFPSKRFHTSGDLHINDTVSNNVTPIFLRRENNPKVIVDQYGEHSLSSLVNRSFALSELIIPIIKPDKKFIKVNARIALMCPNDSSYVVAQWATWMSGGVVVPLCPTHPSCDLEYFVQDSESQLILYTEDFTHLVKPLSDKLSVPALKLEKKDQVESETSLKTVDAQRRMARVDRRNRLIMEQRNNNFKDKNALIIYTSGTTGRPKGVVHTHGSLQAQMDGMVAAWEWSVDDTILHVLPLHHIHGIVNVLMTPLAVGAQCVMLPKFDAAQVWQMLLSPVSCRLPRPINLFMAVPTIYAKLIEHYNRQMGESGSLYGVSKYGVRDICLNHIRLMVSGSAALPQPVMEEWHAITGHTLLERYGMTEVGMALTNPLHGTRVPGAVGLPFPGVQARIRSASGIHVLSDGNKNHTIVARDQVDKPGELEISGDSVFTEYLNRPEATAETFTYDGWFKTGDTAVYEDDVFKILGRTSVDIIKSGGYKISALDIERHILAHDVITDVAVVGLPDVTYGEKIAALIVLQPGEKMELEDLREWCKERMPKYHIPTVFQVLETMPRNAMGKVNKKELLKTIFYV